MYGLDINFLKDRPDYNPQIAVTSSQPALDPASKLPIIIGGAVGLVALAGTGGAWLFFQSRNSSLTEEKTKVEQELANQQKDQQSLAQINGEINAVKAQTQSLASVFTQIKPWSALLQEIRDLTPPGVQIINIAQSTVPNPPPPLKPISTATPAPAPAPAPAPTATPAPAPAPTATPAPAPAAPAAPPVPTNTSQVDITGTARSFDEVNDFVLTLKKSRFFRADKTTLLSANLVPNTTQVQILKRKKDQVPSFTVELPEVVTYRIQTLVSDIPASDLIKELDKNGAVGLVTRLKTLQEILKPKGDIKK
jgi:type IV pilus assembly protein PilN